MWGEEVEHAGRWAKGIWLGRSWNSNEHIIVHANGISRPRTIRRLPDERKWRGDLIEKATTAPWGEDLARDEDDEVDDEDKPDCAETPLGSDPDILPDKKTQEPAVKNIYLWRADFTKHGWTEGCAKCRFMVLPKP